MLPLPGGLKATAEMESVIYLSEDMINSVSPRYAILWKGSPSEGGKLRDAIVVGE